MMKLHSHQGRLKESMAKRKIQKRRAKKEKQR